MKSSHERYDQSHHIEGMSLLATLGVSINRWDTLPNDLFKQCGTCANQHSRS